MAKNSPTPIEAAKTLRVGFEAAIQKTWKEYFSATPPLLSAHWFAKMVHEQAHCSFADAAGAVEAIVPELFASYWDNLPSQQAA